jgi:hypothetical protein
MVLSGSRSLDGANGSTQPAARHHLPFAAAAGWLDDKGRSWQRNHPFRFQSHFLQRQALLNGRNIRSVSSRATIGWPMNPSTNTRHQFQSTPSPPKT